MKKHNRRPGNSTLAALSLLFIVAVGCSSDDAPVDRDTAHVDAHLPDTAIPDTGIVDTSMPDTSIPDISMPDTSMPDTSMPDTSMPDTNIPDASISDTTTDPDTSHDLDTTVPDVTTAPDTTTDPDTATDPDTGPSPTPRGQPCPEVAADTSGTAWSGWGNLQWPERLHVEAGATSEPVYGQVYREGHTDASGQAEGWEAQLAVGPLGAHPIDDAGCFMFIDAQFNIDTGNNDEYRADVTLDEPGLYAMFFRYRPPGGQWLYGGLNGSDHGIKADDAAILVVEGPRGADTLRVATMNLMCRAERWDERVELVADALAGIDADFIGLQEDCLGPNGRTQASELRQALARRRTRGYEIVHQVTHQSTFGDDSFDEGISILSAFPIEASEIMSLPHTHFHRRAISIDVRAEGEPLRLYNAHFDHSSASYPRRTESAQQIVDALPAERFAVVLGDFNSSPTSDAIAIFSTALTDAWPHLNPNDEGKTFPASSPEVRLDYVFVQDGNRLQQATLLDERSGDLLMSDHLGVGAILDWP